MITHQIKSFLTFLQRTKYLYGEMKYRTETPVKQVMVFSSAYYGEIEYPVCPRCKHTMEREYMAFCDRCGQKLSWDNYEQAAVIHR